MRSKAAVATVPGDNFYAIGSEGERYLRFAFCRSLDTLEAAIERLRRGLRLRVAEPTQDSRTSGSRLEREAMLVAHSLDSMIAYDVPTRSSEPFLMVSSFTNHLSVIGQSSFASIWAISSVVRVSAFATVPCVGLPNSFRFRSCRSLCSHSFPASSSRPRTAKLPSPDSGASVLSSGVTLGCASAYRQDRERRRHQARTVVALVPTRVPRWSTSRSNGGGLDSGRERR